MIAAADAGRPVSEAEEHAAYAAWVRRNGSAHLSEATVRAMLEAAAAVRPTPAGDAAEVVAPPDLESPEWGRNLFRAVIGESYKPHVWGRHRALHHTSVRFALDMADRSMPEVADVLRAMVWQQVVVDNRSRHAFDRATVAEAALAEERAENDRLRAVLRKVEWAGTHHSCPVCDAVDPTFYGPAGCPGHAPGCTLAAALNPERTAP